MKPRIFVNNTTLPRYYELLVSFAEKEFDVIQELIEETIDECNEIAKAYKLMCDENGILKDRIRTLFGIKSDLLINFFFLLEKHSTLTMGEFLLWAAAEFAVSGYIINQIQKEKKETTTSDEENPQTP